MNSGKTNSGATRKFWTGAAALAAAFMLVSLAPSLSLSRAAAAAPAKPGDFGKSGEPLPRFASLGSDKVNLRIAPGRRYPIEWVYQRKGLPVQVVDEYDDWRRIRDPDGVEGWVFKNLLSDNRTAIVAGDQIRTLFAANKPNAKGVWRAAPGVVFRLVACEDAWCEVINGNRSGWILRQHLWGVSPIENFRD